MEDPLKISYSFSFDDGSTKTFDILIDREDLVSLPREHPDPPSWAEMNRHKCENCTLDEKANPYCPIALNLSEIAKQFIDLYSYENVAVTVTTDDREYFKKTSVQEGLGALVGIVMVTSGCPSMEKLKPMVRFHQPFATLIETVYRTVTMYLLAQYYLHQDGRPADWELRNLDSIYADVSIVNRDFAKRLLEAAKKDANVNALVNLDCFASMVTMTAEDTLRDIRPYYSALLLEKKGS